MRAAFGYNSALSAALRYGLAGVGASGPVRCFPISDGISSWICICAIAVDIDDYGSAPFAV